jgi:hypothetical protein
MNKSTSHSRPLTDSETMMLHLLQELYGPWNTVENVFISDQDEAVIFVKDAAGVSGLIVNLTNCAAMYADGSVSLEELKSQWLRPAE